MVAPIVISLDAMGGDHGPEVVVPGAQISLERNPGLRFKFFGDQERIRPVLDAHGDLAARSEIVHSDVSIAMDAKPSQALRQGRRTSSMWMALQAVADGDADVMVSGGNTGALMAMAKFCLKTIAGVERPAIAAIWPTVERDCVVLDMGANVGADATQLVDFALLGAAMARAVFGLESPRVGLLNIGVEEVKGLGQVKEAHTRLRAADLPMTYIGFVEGNQIGHGVADVVVSEGFSGNIALKTAEGTANQIAVYLREAMNRSLLSRLGALLARDAFAYLKHKMDPRRLNGGVFLGLDGIAIKSHGGTDATGFASAIDLGYDMARNGLISAIRHEHERSDMLSGLGAPDDRAIVGSEG